MLLTPSTIGEILAEVFAFVRTNVLFLLGIGCGALLIAAVIMPLSTLRWWAGWAEEKRPGDDVSSPPEAATGMDRSGGGTHYLVYFSGISDVSGTTLSRRETVLLQNLAARLSGLVIVHDIYAYSATNEGMIEERWIGGFWAWLYQQQLNRTPAAPLGWLINVRNLLQFAVSADARYGPIYNYGTSSLVVHELIRRGYPLGSGVPVVVAGYSGGGQVALGTARYLAATLRAPVRVISLGGVMANDPGIAAADHLYHLYGTADVTPKLGAILFPGRWPIFANSDWNRARAAGKITDLCLGPMEHTGRRGYLDASTHLADGTSYLAMTEAAIARIIDEPTSLGRAPESAAANERGGSSTTGR